jgi:hypothetical protein
VTDAQKLVTEIQDLIALNPLTNTWKWTQRAIKTLTFLENSVIGSLRGGHVYNIKVFTCADGSRFGYDMNGARQHWSFPK